MSPLRHELRFRRDHRWTPAHMSAYLDSDLSAVERARLARHTSDCPECRSVIEDLRRMIALLQSAPAPEPVADAPAIASAVLRRLHEPADR
ncbi:MAG: anti-sigma factor family protein [Solirubrobacteraceae bacterium]